MAAAGRFVRALPKNSALFMCDMQTEFLKAAAYGPQIAETSSRLLESAKALDMPVVVSEHQPEEFGSVIGELDVKGLPLFRKTKYSMVVPELKNHLQTLPDVKNIILCGVAAHVCIKQTAMDLLDSGYSVHLVVDAISSPKMADRLSAFDSLREAGAQVTTSESVILGLVADAAHPNFRAVQKIIWDSAPDTGLVTAADSQ